MNKSEFLKVLRDLVGEGRTEDAFDFLHDHIKDFAAYFVNDVVMLKNQFVSAKNQFSVKGIIENSEFGRISARVNLAILELADKIEKKSETTDLQRKGHLLHKIPSKMIKDRETKCIVRIAYFLEHLFVGLTIDDNITVQVIQITKLMSVELLDDNETKIFEIRTSTDEEQFTIHEECTQWIFHVRPIRTGNFPLLLKIGAVEVINGKERKRNLIIEKEIIITVESNIKVEDNFEIISWEDENFVEILKEEKHRKYKELKELERLEKEHLEKSEVELKRREDEKRIREAIQKAEKERTHWEQEMKRMEEEKRKRQEQEMKRMEEEKRKREVYAPNPKYGPPPPMPEPMPTLSNKRGCSWILIIVIAIIIAVILWYTSKK
jgi:hypothetical protein